MLSSSASSGISRPPTTSPTRKVFAGCALILILLISLYGSSYFTIRHIDDRLLAIPTHEPVFEFESVNDAVFNKLDEIFTRLLGSGSPGVLLNGDTYSSANMTSIRASFSRLPKYTAFPDMDVCLSEDYLSQVDIVEFTVIEPSQSHSISFTRLFLDHVAMSSSEDEAAYHEFLVHPAMLATRKPPQRVLIGGGAEGATAREILKHQSVRQVIMVDIDSELVDACRLHLPSSYADGCWTDTRFENRPGDVMDMLRLVNNDPSQRFDVIILDLLDPDYLMSLYTAQFFSLVHSALRPGGVMSINIGPALAYNGIRLLRERIELGGFATTSQLGSLYFYVPSWLEKWGALMAYNTASELDVSVVDLYQLPTRFQPPELHPEMWHFGAQALDVLLRARLGTVRTNQLKYLNGRALLYALHPLASSGEIARGIY